MAGKKATETIDILKVSKGEVTFYLLGDSPLIFNRLSQKGYKELMFPKGRKTAAEKRSTMKHDPLTEFWDSPYTSQEPDGETYLQGLAVWFKKAMAGASLDIPGARKSQTNRLVYVKGDRIDIYGIPQIYTTITRSADIKRTPDTRTRCIIPRWACSITVQYVTPLVKAKDVMHLLGAAGMMQGVGDYRIEKGAGNYGSFRIVPDNDKEWHHIASTGGRARQLEAMRSPERYDDETTTILDWFEGEVNERGFRDHAEKARATKAAELGLSADN